MLFNNLSFICFIYGLVFTNVKASTEYNHYLAYFFQKYGNGGTITFEGLEHLMFSLGLGQIEFEPEHTIDLHRPKGYKNMGSNMNKTSNLIEKYFEQQVKKFLISNDSQESDIELSAIDATTTVEENGVILQFREMHDPKHRHPRENVVNLEDTPLPVPPNTCLSPKLLLNLVVDHEDLHKHKLYKTVIMKGFGSRHDLEHEYLQFINSVRLTPLAFLKLCPALLAQIDNNVCPRPAPMHHDEHFEGQELLYAWMYASISILALSAIGLMGMLLVPLMKSIAYQEILKFLVAIAVGTLSGDALMHLLPHALIQQDKHDSQKIFNTRSSQEMRHHEHNNRAIWLCASAFATALFMYIIENLIPLITGGQQGGHGHSHSGHSHATHAGEKPKTNLPTQLESIEHMPPAQNRDAHEVNVMLYESKTDLKMVERSLTPVAFMVVIGDGLHNLTDGLAIGAAFATAPVTGFATAFAVLCHELPHELGDFALLLQTGVSLRRAIYLNIISSFLSFIGMGVGLLIASTQKNVTQWIYACTAGSFLYIAFADLIPTMSVAHNANASHNIKDMLIQIIGILLGGLIMLLIAVNEHELEAIFKYV